MSDYNDAGFDDFLSRSIDETPQINLAAPGPVSTSIAYDRAGVSGMLGDTLQVGNVRINKNNIIVSDGQNDRLLLGEQTDGF